MKCKDIFCENEATTIIKLKVSSYRGRTYCDDCVARVKRQDDNPERPCVYTGKFEYIPIEEAK